MDRKFVLTGTQVFGPAGPESDIDIVMYHNEAEALKTRLYNTNIDTYQTEMQIKHNYPGFYFNLGVLKINIICAPDTKEMKRWEHATNRMLEKNPMSDRETRIALFKKFFLEDV